MRPSPPHVAERRSPCAPRHPLAGPSLSLPCDAQWREWRLLFHVTPAISTAAPPRDMSRAWPVAICQDHGRELFTDSADPAMLSWNRGGGTKASCRGASALFNNQAALEMWPAGFAYDLDVAFPSALLRSARTPTPTWRPTVTWAYAEVASRWGTPSKPGTSLPLTRRGWFLASEWPGEG